MKWQNILEAFCAAPSIILEQTIQGWNNLVAEEKDLAEHGEFEESE